jgi:hypothetical protein
MDVLNVVTLTSYQTQMATQETYEVDMPTTEINDSKDGVDFDETLLLIVVILLTIVMVYVMVLILRTTKDVEVETDLKKKI